jgi:Fe-S cluster assembly iron-binding protein IscA
VEALIRQIIQEQLRVQFRDAPLTDFNFSVSSDLNLQKSYLTALFRQEGLRVAIDSNSVLKIEGLIEDYSFECVEWLLKLLNPCMHLHTILEFEEMNEYDSQPRRFKVIFNPFDTLQIKYAKQVISYEY